MERLVETLFSVMPAAFSSEEYQSREKEIGEALQEKQANAMEALEKDAREHEITLIRTPGGFAFAPVREGAVIAPDDYMKLKQEERDQIEKETGRLRDSLQSIMAQFPKWQRETAEKIKELNREVSAFALKPLMDEIRAGYKEVEAVLRYLGEVEKDMIENFGQFLEKESPDEGPLMMPQSFGPAGRRLSTVRYRVNVMIDNSQLDGAPVILEDKPASQNLVGDIEHAAQMGTLITDFTLIKPGALHRANGGYLILDARRLLLEPFAWEALKKALRTRQIRISNRSRSSTAS
jgi:predicted ATP-dependent protease